LRINRARVVLLHFNQREAHAFLPPHLHSHLPFSSPQCEANECLGDEPTRREYDQMLAAKEVRCKKIACGITFKYSLGYPNVADATQI
jgi:hypothetical protein